MIVGSVDIIAGNAVQLVGGEKLTIDGGPAAAWAERFARVGDVAVIDLDAALTQGSNADLIKTLCRRLPCRVGGGIRDLDTARAYLNAGARKIIIGTKAEPDFLRELPADRLMVALDGRHDEVVVDGWRKGTGQRIGDRLQELAPYVSGFLVTFVEREGRMVGIDLDRVAKLAAILKESSHADCTLTIAGGVSSADEVAALDRLGVDAQVGMALYNETFHEADSLAASLTSDRADGLWPTVVCDQLGRSLGLVYSNAESLKAALTEGRGIYWSRKRGLWRKGESSGATQKLLRVELDCDRDALRFVVEQSGDGFCHRSTRSCFGPGNGDLSGLETMAALVEERRTSAPAGSYTRSLFDSPALLEEKLVEEATELAKATAAPHVCSEAADLVYFLSAKLAQAGVSLADVDAELKRRRTKLTRRDGSVQDQRGVEATAEPALAPPASELPWLTPTPAGELTRTHFQQDSVVENRARVIVDQVRLKGEKALRRFGERFGECASGQPLWIEKAELDEAAAALDPDSHGVLKRTKERIAAFAEWQKLGTAPGSMDVDGGTAGQEFAPIRRVGCYVPGGRYPLPSSLLMTAVPARVAGVAEVIVASPRPTPVVLAAASIAGVDRVLRLGGAHAIAALAFGTVAPPVDLIVGPGSAWVDAAKRYVFGEVGIDLPAGPSELLVVADHLANPRVVAADLIAQAEHDPRARVTLLTTDATLPARVETELSKQLEHLKTADVAAVALRRWGASAVCTTREAVVEACDALAPEHLALHVEKPDEWLEACSHYGAAFLGGSSAEVFADYGVGPNHVLPTGGAARYSGGLSVMTFLRRRSWLKLTAPTPSLLHDVAKLARLEGLEGHARAAEQRRD